MCECGECGDCDPHNRAIISTETIIAMITIIATLTIITHDVVLCMIVMIYHSNHLVWLGIITHDRATVVILYIVCYNHHNHTTIPLGCKCGLVCNIAALWSMGDHKSNGSWAAEIGHFGWSEIRPSHRHSGSDTYESITHQILKCSKHITF